MNGTSKVGYVRITALSVLLSLIRPMRSAIGTNSSDWGTRYVIATVMARSAGDLKAMGRIGLKAIIYFEVATTIALFLGLLLVNVFKPGAGVDIPLAGDTSAVSAMSQAQQRPWDIFLHLFPTSVVDSMARGDILQVVVFSMFFGVALAAIGERGRPVLELLESTAQVMFKFTAYVMKFAPIGVMAAMAATVGGKGLAILFTLGKLVLTMYAGLILFVLGYMLTDTEHGNREILLLSLLVAAVVVGIALVKEKVGAGKAGGGQVGDGKSAAEVSDQVR